MAVTRLFLADTVGRLRSALLSRVLIFRSLLLLPCQKLIVDLSLTVVTA